MKWFVCGVFVCLISACSSVKSDSQEGDQDVYKLAMLANTETNNEGALCADATGVIWIRHNKVIGYVKDASGAKFSVFGTVNLNNKLAGGFANTVMTAVDYNGVMSTDRETASGEWEGVYGCRGTWLFEKVNDISE